MVYSTNNGTFKQSAPRCHRDIHLFVCIILALSLITHIFNQIKAIIGKSVIFQSCVPQILFNFFGKIEDNTSYFIIHAFRHQKSVRCEQINPRAVWLKNHCAVHAAIFYPVPEIEIHILNLLLQPVCPRRAINRDSNCESGQSRNLGADRLRKVDSLDMVFLIQPFRLTLIDLHTLLDKFVHRVCVDSIHQEFIFRFSL